MPVSLWTSCDEELQGASGVKEGKRLNLKQFSYPIHFRIKQTIDTLLNCAGDKAPICQNTEKDLPCQRGAGRVLHTFSPVHELPHRTWPQCGHTSPAGFSKHSHVSLQPLVSCGEQSRGHVRTVLNNRGLKSTD